MTTIMLFRIMIVVAFMIMMVMRVSGPGRKWIGEALPMFRALSHLFIREQTGIELGLKGMSVRFKRHDCKRLPAIAEGLFPFISGALRHLGRATALIARRPPGARRCAVKLRSGKVESTDFIHASGQPEKSFGPENTAQVLLEEIPKPPGMKRPPGATR